MDQKTNSDYYPSSRIESLSDGIFAFAMTLLVINLNAPVLHGLVTNQELIQSLLSLQDNFFSFLLSFFLLASAWGVHHRQFSFINRSDATLMWINMFRLLFVIIIPFSSVLIGNYASLPIAAFFFSFNFFLLSVTSGIEWRYAVKHGLTDNSKFDSTKDSNIKNAVPTIVAGTACLVALINPNLSLWLYLLIPVAFIALKKTGKVI